MAHRSERAAPALPGTGPEVIDRIAGALRGLRFGSVEITVHEGEVVQIERREKLRLNPERGRGLKNTP